MGPTEVLNLVASGFTIVGASIGAGISRLYDAYHNKRLLRERMALLQRAAVAGELAITVGIGGKGQPEDDVALYLRKTHPAIQHLLVYQTPPVETLGEAVTALRVAEDLRGWVEEFGKGQIVKVHFFPAGMLAYPFLMGALLKNISTVIVYQKDLTSGSYVPLYEWSGAFANGHKRLSRQLTKMRTVPLSAPVVSPAASPPAVSPAPVQPVILPPPTTSAPVPPPPTQP